MTVRTSLFCIHAARLLLAAIIAIFITLHLSPRKASAATKLWGGGNNDWSKASSWLPAGIPVNGDTVTINISNGCTVTYDSLIAESDLFSFTVSSQPGALADTLSMPFNNILKTSDREYIGGYVGSPAGGNTGTFNQSNGTNNVGFSVGRQSHPWLQRPRQWILQPQRRHPHHPGRRTNWPQRHRCLYPIRRLQHHQ